MIKQEDDWHTLMAFGLGVLRLSSQDFWLMTLREITAAASAVNPQRVPPLSRAWLKEAMRANPDKKHTERNKL
ncbi:phage tail assembly chaperone [Pseudahrensia aquimaris]|uniref:Phage tail assembly chaperone n=1 Tax=Pseudahrensia aquimaris TaxID=744461 RepID=A0ABW3FDK9_9HYPH